ncbi:hypothetical protein [Klebsiella pneumoniae]|uniref:hypothetical protein n=1 Tax=Klebsiella pneumoniae TaxID=573 RepID=UPI00396F7130
MAREQGRDVHILAADNRSRNFLPVRDWPEKPSQANLPCRTGRLSRRDLNCRPAEKLSLKETISCSMAPCAIT